MKNKQSRAACLVKVFRAIRSCRNEDQLKDCRNLITNFNRQFEKQFNFDEFIKQQREIIWK